MKKVFLLLLITGCIACGQKEKTTSVTLHNTTDRERIDESFIIKASQLIAPGQGLVPVLKTPDGLYVSSQFDDINEDQQWDELAFVCTLASKEILKLTVEWINPATYPEFPTRTNVRFGKMTSPGCIKELTTDIL